MEHLGLYFLQANYIGIVVSDLFYDDLLSVVPGKSPVWTITIHLSCGILVTQDVITHDCEETSRFGSSWLTQSQPWSWRWSSLTYCLGQKRKTTSASFLRRQSKTKQLQLRILQIFSKLNNPRKPICQSKCLPKSSKNERRR